MRSLADDLRARSDGELAQLVLLRPDLTRPAPADLTSLAARSVTRASLSRALDDLDTGHLQVLEALAVLGSADGVSPVARLLGAPTPRVEPRLDELWRRALVWRSGRTRHVPRPVVEALGPFVAGLAPGGNDIPESVDELAGPGDLDATQRAVLDRLTWGPPIGHLPTQGAAAHAAHSLLAAGWLVRGTDDQVVLPRSRALALRGGRLHRELAFEPPALHGREVPDAQVATTAGGQAVHVLGLLDELITAWEIDPPRVLRSGGLAVRDLKGLSQKLDVTPGLAAFLVEVARDAGLIVHDHLLDAAWVPTHDYDDWVQLRVVDRWIRLVRAWLDSTRAPHRVGSPPPASPHSLSSGGSGSGTINALSDGASWPRLRVLRREILAELLDVPPGQLIEDAALIDRLSWRHPLRPPTATTEAVGATRQAAEWLGVTGRGALPEAVRPLLVSAGIGLPGVSAYSASAPGVPAPGVPTPHLPAPGAPAPSVSGSSDSPGTLEAPDALESPRFGGGPGAPDVPFDASVVAAMLPQPVEHMVLQADLTAVVPGPLGPGLRALLRTCAERESRGGAGVYRFSATSVRRGLDAGRGAQSLLDDLARASVTPVPQPLTYLVNDVARRHGALRLGGIACYVRCDDPAVLDALVARRELAHADLRRLAPTVVVSTMAPLVLLELLRDAGGTPILEGPDGVAITAQEPKARAHRRSTPPVLTSAPSVFDAHRLVADLRAGQQTRDRADAAANNRDDGPAVPATDPAVVLSMVREAIARRGAVWIGLADASGATRRLLLHPHVVEGGRIHGYLDEAGATGAARSDRGRGGDLRVLSLHRITGAVLAD